MLTYCPHCKTAFRVNEAHLQARRGRVRCGRCNGIFNALENLVKTPTTPTSAHKTIVHRSRTRSSSTDSKSKEKTSSRTHDPKPTRTAAPSSSETIERKTGTAPLDSNVIRERRSDSNRTIVTKTSEKTVTSSKTEKKRTDNTAQPTQTKVVHPKILPTDSVDGPKPSLERVLKSPHPFQTPAEQPDNTRSARKSPPNLDGASSKDIVPPSFPPVVDTQKQTETSAATQHQDELLAEEIRQLQSALRASRSRQAKKRADRKKSESVANDETKSSRKPSSTSPKPQRPPQRVENQLSESPSSLPLLETNVESYFSIVPADEITVTFNDTITFPLNKLPGNRPGNNAAPAQQWTEAPVRVRKKSSHSRQNRLPAIGIVILLLFLAIQCGIYFRNTLSYQYPLMKPALKTLCLPFRCTIDPMRNASLLHPEYSNMQLVDPASNLMLFTATITNRANEDQDWPYIELTLTDALDVVVARKILKPDDYLPPEHTPLFPPRGDLAIRLWLEMTGLDAVNFRMTKIFYP